MRLITVLNIKKKKQKTTQEINDIKTDSPIDLFPLLMPLLFGSIDVRSHPSIVVCWCFSGGQLLMFSVNIQMNSMLKFN